tara:strand:+ start:331 stop:1509 length:1179 start_codon:yes stop_codon:yes gene_type:complete
MKNIFLDYNSTTPVDKQVIEEMLPYFNETYGNASSRNHQFGLNAMEAVKIARKRIANLINSNQNEIIFTSGATESVNLAIKGYMGKNKGKGNHIITPKTEHKAVLDTCSVLEQQGFQITYLNVLNNGLIDINELENAFTDETLMVSVMHVNNEIGVIQPIEEIAKICKNKGVAFFVDAAQSFGKIDIDVKKMHIDYLCASAHKIYGPKGIGLLYINRDKDNYEIFSQIDGGGHEHGFRSGTLNVPGIVGFGAAAKLAESRMEKDSESALKLRDRLINGLNDNIDGFYINGDLSHRLPGNINVSFDGVNGDALLINMEEIAVSNGAACSSNTKEPSYVLKALGIKDKLAEASLRICIGRYTTEEEIDYTINKLKDVIQDLRGIEELKAELSNE